MKPLAAALKDSFHSILGKWLEKDIMRWTLSYSLQVFKWMPMQL